MGRKVENFVSIAHTERLLSEAAKLRLEGRREAALQRLKAVLDVQPDNVAANLAKADLMMDAGLAQAGLSALRRAAEAVPESAAVWMRYVFELRRAGLKSRARKAARASRLAGSGRRTLMEIAEGRTAPLDDIAALIRQGRHREAWNVGSERAGLFPDDARLLNLLGVAALSNDEPIRAEDVLRRALKLDSTSQPVLANLGLALVRQGRASEADEFLSTLSSHPDASFEVRVNHAGALVRMDRMAEALGMTEKLIRANPDDAELIAIRSQAFLATDRASEALDLLERHANEADFTLQDLMADAIDRLRGRNAALISSTGCEIRRCPRSRVLRPFWRSGVN